MALTAEDPRRPGGARIAALDVLRGIAVLGILVVNVQQLFLPMILANEPVPLRAGHGGELVAWFISDAFFESKFLTIFSLLFGAGFCLQWLRYREADRPFTPLYLRRLAALIGFGLIHATFFYPVDVLALYGLTALVLLLFRNRSARSMIRTGAIVLALMTLWHVLLSGPNRNAAQQHQQVVQNLNSIRSERTVVIGGQTWTLPVPESVVARHLNGDIHSVDEAAAQALAFGRGPAILAVRERVTLFSRFIGLFAPFFLLWRTLALFLIAAGLVKNGFLQKVPLAAWRRTATVGFAVGIPLSVTASFVRIKAYHTPGALTFAGSAMHDISALLLAAAISSLVLIWCRDGVRGRVGRSLSAVGRLALTNYIGQSAIMTLIATSPGLGWYGRLDRTGMLLLCIPVLAVQIAASNLWTNYFRMGPLEYIWRAITYRSWPAGMWLGHRAQR